MSQSGSRNRMEKYRGRSHFKSRIGLGSFGDKVAQCFWEVDLGLITQLLNFNIKVKCHNVITCYLLKSHPQTSHLQTYHLLTYIVQWSSVFINVSHCLQLYQNTPKLSHTSTFKLSQHPNTVDEMAVVKTTVDKTTLFLCVIMRQYKWRYAKIPIIVWPKNTWNNWTANILFL